MVARFLVEARHCCEVDDDRIIEAGGRLMTVGRIEDDGTVMVAIDVPSHDRDASLRLTQLFAPISAH